MESVILLGVVQAFFSAFVLISKRPKNLADKILIGWLITFGILFVIGGIKRFCQLEFNVIGANLLITIGPFLYQYSYSLIKSSSQYHWKNLLHFVPATALIIISSLIENAMPGPHCQQMFFSGQSVWYRYVFASTFVISFIVYLYLTLRLLKQHEISIEDYYSARSERINLQWIWYVLIFFFIFFFILLTVGVSKLGMLTEVRTHLSNFINIGLVIFIYSVSLFGYRQGYIYNRSKKVVNKPNQEENKLNMARYEKSGLKDKQAGAYKIKLLEHMELQQPWKDSDLTIQSLSDQVSIPKHHITQTINSQLGKNFYHFVNEYRLNEVQKMLGNLEYRSWSIIAVAYECGFNSKSSFNTFFKQQTGLTPSEYRRRNRMNID
ncbi:MAG: helix-turn-helix domain-containing protein [Carboxylicivirga sp.]|jgi:AraC-like DNA-binding protein|nr:helix-turn-helix domain-containing protein [Carboxylicivirga sp.]